MCEIGDRIIGVHLGKQRNLRSGKHVITIHCGLPKTGTSSIQAGLRIARDTSRRQIWVPSERDENSEEWWTQRLTKMGRTRDGILSHEGLLFGNGGKDLISQERVELLRGCL